MGAQSCPLLLGFFSYALDKNLILIFSSFKKIYLLIKINIMFNIISHRAEILVSLVFAVRADINQMLQVSQHNPFLGT